MVAPEVARTASEMAGKAVVLKKWIQKDTRNLRAFPYSRDSHIVVLFGGHVVMQQAGVANHEQMEQWLRSAATVSA